jgi:hypothetical protein
MMESMDIYSEPGTKVIYTGKNGYSHDKKHADEYLEVGKTYTVDHTEVYSWSSVVYLDEIADQSFNTVHFVEAE